MVSFETLEQELEMLETFANMAKTKKECDYAAMKCKHMLTDLLHCGLPETDENRKKVRSFLAKLDSINEIIENKEV